MTYTDQSKALDFIAAYVEKRCAELFAHLTKVRGGYELRISADIRGQAVICRRTFPDKRAARRFAADAHAKPWNF